MARKYYLDTSIWLDFFEDRNEPNIPKGEWARKLLAKVTENNDKIVYSDIIVLELGIAGYSPHEIEGLFREIGPILLFTESTEKQVRKAKDLSNKRNLPQGDALHALISRDCRATLVTLDRHFKKLLDIAEPTMPQDII
ncbi:PIN domain-containing protein [Candidatus Woesearchaeota archaeon]|nr:PIN domain-containing protein [Candidatus Woesearchaeota archaeon]